MKELRVEIRLTIIGGAITGIYAGLCVTYFFWYRTVPLLWNNKTLLLGTWATTIIDRR